MSWTLAPALVTLKNQVNAVAPNRSKKSDGTIGDAAHATSASDHNPNSSRVVCGMDLTHDPANGFDADKFAEAQRKNPHPDLKYLVWKGRIASRKYNWTWRPSSGHTKHIHVSVGIGTDGKSLPGTYNNTSNWNLGATMSADKLTKEEVIVLHEAEFGGVPGVNYDFHHVGGPLGKLLDDWHPSKDSLRNQKKAGTLINKADCPVAVVTGPITTNPVIEQKQIDAIAEAVANKLAARLKE